MRFAVLCVLLAAPVARADPDDTLTVFPRNESMWTGRANVDGGKWSGNLAIITNPDFRAWAMFDLSTIPDTVMVTGAVLHYVTFPGRDSAFGLWRHLSNDPRTASGPEMYAECGTAPVTSDTAYEPVSGPATRALNSAGVAAVQSGLAVDRVAFGWQRYDSDGWRYARGIETPADQPFLVVTFSAAVGVEERDEGGRMRAEPRHTSMVRGVLLLTGNRPALLLDVFGRRVTDLRPGVNDIRSVSPGIYFLRSAVGGELSAVGRILIQR